MLIHNETLMTTVIIENNNTACSKVKDLVLYVQFWSADWRKDKVQRFTHLSRKIFVKMTDIKIRPKKKKKKNQHTLLKVPFQ